MVLRTSSLVSSDVGRSRRMLRTSKTNQDGGAVDIRYLKNGAAAALRKLREHRSPDDSDLVFDGLSAQSIGNRFGAAAAAAGIETRLTAHSGRVGLASELTARGASATETMLAGNWKTARMVAHYSAGAAAELGAVKKYFVITSALYSRTFHKLRNEARRLQTGSSPFSRPQGTRIGAAAMLRSGSGFRSCLPCRARFFRMLFPSAIALPGTCSQKSHSSIAR